MDDDSDYIDLDDQIGIIVKSLFTETGPHYDAPFNDIVKELIAKRLEDSPGEIREITKLILVSGFVNSVLVTIMDEVGPDIISSILKSMSERYASYNEAEEKLH